MKAKNYRDYIYGNYSDTLIVKQITGDLKRERMLIAKYFQKNYLPYMPNNKNRRLNACFYIFAEKFNFQINY